MAFCYGLHVCCAKVLFYIVLQNNILLCCQICNFAADTKNDKETMTALELNAELFKELSIIVQDETMMQKAVKALRRITERMKAKDTTDYILSSPAMAEIIRQGEEDIKQGRGKKINLKELWINLSR